MGWPEKQAVIPALGKNASPQFGKIEHVALLGHGANLKWTQAAEGLKLELPQQAPSDYGVTFKITGA
jgi:alpha-L-fucosidase